MATTKQPIENKNLSTQNDSGDGAIDTRKTGSSTQSVVIAVLATALGCFVLVFAILALTGVIKFGGDSTPAGGNSTTTTDTTGGTSGGGSGSSDSGEKIIQNPNPKVSVHDATHVEVGDLEFYLPDDFEAGGKNADGAYTYNLVDDDGWAQVLVFVEKTNLSPEKYLGKISSYLDITDDDYQMNGTSWVQGENASALAYATELDGTVYAVYYSVKLDSDDTAEAMSMIPKTLYMNKVYR